VVDNLVNSCEDSVERVKEITGCASGALEFRNLDLLNLEGLDDLFKEYSFDACIHFAGLKAVGESVSQPLTYYHNNIVGTLNLLEVMNKYK
jgi:UDP-glucose 4-epimerase